MNNDNRGFFELLVRFWVPCVMMILLIVCLCSREAPAQSSGYVLCQPNDLGAGLRVDYYPMNNVFKGWRKPGIYHSASYGNWRLYRKYGLDHHFKLTTGILIPLRPYHSWHYDVSSGINYHRQESDSQWDPRINHKLYDTWSYELGITVKMRWFALCLATDIKRWDPCVGVGILF